MFDRSHMDCEPIQAALSARADDEAPGVPETVVAWHLRTCGDCAAFAAAIERLGSQTVAAHPVGVPAHPSNVDVSGRVATLAGRVDRGSVWWGMRAALFVVALGELRLAIPDLVARASGVADDVHMQRHLGAFQIAYSVGLIVVALRPAKARALVPLTAALAVAMVGAAIVDIAQGITPALGEAEHALEIAGLLLVWMLAARKGWPGYSRHALRTDVVSERHAPADAAVIALGGQTRGLRGRHTA